MTGTVYLVGAGPGAVDLLTVRATKLLAQADIVLHDALVSQDVLALATRAKLYNVGKRAKRVSVDQRFIGRLLVRSALRHNIVVRLKGGDPHLFARMTEEIEACRRAGIPVVTTPGISAAFAAASSLGVSLTSRGVSRSLAFVTPVCGGDTAVSAHWADAAAAADTAVIYMGVLQAEAVAAALLTRGVPAARAVALVEGASTAAESIVRGQLQDLPKLTARLGDGPAIVLIGETVADTASSMSEASAA